MVAEECQKAADDVSAPKDEVRSTFRPHRHVGSNHGLAVYNVYELHHQGSGFLSSIRSWSWFDLVALSCAVGTTGVQPRGEDCPR